MLPIAQTACSITNSIFDFNSSVNSCNPPLSTTHWVWRLDPDAILDKHQVASDFNDEYSICFAN
jgi:hypothetical protein